MSQRFDSGLHTQQDFAMMNNNYLPAIPRYNGTATSNISNPLNGMNVLQRTPNSGLNSRTQAGSAFVQNNQVGNMSMNIVHSGVNLMHAGSQSTVNSGINICEHQGAMSGSNLSNTGCPSQQWNSVFTSESVVNSVNSSGCFTFTTPTQSYVYSPTVTATTQNRLQYSRVTPHNFAPTGTAQWQHTIPQPTGTAQWQHTIPQRMPWLHHSRMVNQQGINVFTGSGSNTTCSLSDSCQIPGSPMSQHLMHPIASCSTVFKRPKRRHDAEHEELSPTNKVHLTEEKIASHMKELRIHNCSPPPQVPAQPPNNTLFAEASHENLVNSYQHMQQLTDPPWATSNSSLFLRQTTQQQWQNYEQLENRLDMFDDEMSDNEDQTGNNTTDEQKLHIIQDFNPAIDPEPVLPKQIMDNILNPCRQLMLWSPPGGVKCVTSPDLDPVLSPVHANTVDNTADLMESDMTASDSSWLERKGMDGVQTDDVDEMAEL